MREPIYRLMYEYGNNRRGCIEKQKGTALSGFVDLEGARNRMIEVANREWNRLDYMTDYKIEVDEDYLHINLICSGGGIKMHVYSFYIVCDWRNVYEHR